MEDHIGDIVGYPGFRTYDDDWNGGRYWQYIGYPGERSSGERPAFQGDCVVTTADDEGQSGQTGYVIGHFNEFTPGQSGGSVWGWWRDEPWPRVVGVGSNERLRDQMKRSATYEKPSDARRRKKNSQSRRRAAP